MTTYDSLPVIRENKTDSGLHYALTVTLGLKPETREILRYILKKVEGGGYATTAELMDEFDKTKQTLNHQIKILREEGLVENGDIKRPDGKIDRRYRSIVLTQQGRLVASWI